MQEQQEIENSKEYNIVKGLVDKSTDLSLKMYEKVGLHNAYIEELAKQINVLSAPLILRITCLLDSQIDQSINKVQQTQKAIIDQTNKKKQELIEKTQQTKEIILQTHQAIIEKTNQTKQQLLEKTENTKQQFLKITNNTKKDIIDRAFRTKDQLVDKAKNSTIVKKADDYGNILFDEVEQQLELLKKQLKKTLNLQIQEHEEGQNQDKLDLYTRANNLGHQLNFLGKQITTSYINYLQQLPVIQLAQKKYSQADAKVLAAKANIESFIDVVFCTVLTQNIVNPLLGFLQVKYNKSKESVSIIIQNVRNYDINQILVESKNRYEALHQALAISLKQNKLSLIFSKEFFLQSKDSIEKDIRQLMTDINAIRIKAIEKGLELYKQSLEQFKIKKNNKLWFQEQQQQQQLHQ